MQLFNSGHREVSVDEGLTWNSAFSVELERIASKASLEIRKNTDEDIKIRQVTVKQLPSFSFLSPSAYPLSGGLTVTDTRSFSTPVSIAGEKDVPQDIRIHLLYRERIALSCRSTFGIIQQGRGVLLLWK